MPSKKNSKNEPAGEAVGCSHVQAQDVDCGAALSSVAVPEFVPPEDRLPSGVIAAAVKTEAAGSYASSSGAPSEDRRSKGGDLLRKKQGKNAAAQQLRDRDRAKLQASEGITAESTRGAAQKSEGRRNSSESAPSLMDEKARIKDRRLMGSRASAGSKVTSASAANDGESGASIVEEKARLKERRMVAYRASADTSTLVPPNDLGVGVAAISASASGSEIQAHIPEQGLCNSATSRQVSPGAHNVPGISAMANELPQQSADRNDSSKTEDSAFRVLEAEAVDINDAGGDALQDLTNDVEMLQQKVEDQQRQLEKQQQQQAAAVVAEPMPEEQNKPFSSPHGQWRRWCSDRKVLVAVLGLSLLLVVGLAVGLGVAMGSSRGSSSSSDEKGFPTATSTPSLQPTQSLIKAATMTPSLPPTDKLVTPSPAPTALKGLPARATSSPVPRPSVVLTPNNPTHQPTALPIAAPTALPTPLQSSQLPTSQPTHLPSVAPSPKPTPWPSSFPTQGFSSLRPAAPEVTSRPTREGLGELQTTICSRLPGTCLDLASEGTPQSTALEWVASDPNFDKYSLGRQIQRYALGTIYHSLQGWGVDDVLDWMGQGENECAWRGVACYNNGWVSAINPQDELTAGGRPLPRDVALLNSSFGELL